MNAERFTRNLVRHCKEDAGLGLGMVKIAMTQEKPKQKDNAQAEANRRLKMRLAIGAAGTLGTPLAMHTLEDRPNMRTYMDGITKGLKQDISTAKLTLPEGMEKDPDLADKFFGRKFSKERLFKELDENEADAVFGSKKFDDWVKRGGLLNPAEDVNHEKLSDFVKFVADKEAYKKAPKFSDLFHSSPARRRRLLKTSAGLGLMSLGLTGAMYGLESNPAYQRATGQGRK